VHQRFFCTTIRSFTYMSWIYLLLNIFTFSGPLTRTFEPRIYYFGKWKALFTAIGLTAAFFIIWDVFFTKIGIWSFNPPYLVGVDLGNLPIEEWLFFITIPYACLFIYEVYKYFFKDFIGKNAFYLAWLVILLNLAAIFFYYDRWYTCTTSVLVVLMLLLELYVIKGKYLGYFFIGYMISLVPFLLVNGVLTALPVVIYNDLENVGTRIYTIPVEDTMYMLLLLLMNTSIYEYLKKRWGVRSKSK